MAVKKKLRQAAARKKPLKRSGTRLSRSKYSRPKRGVLVRRTGRTGRFRRTIRGRRILRRKRRPAVRRHVLAYNAAYNAAFNEAYSIGFAQGYTFQIQQPITAP